MYTARKKIQKDKGVEPSEFEDSVAQVRAPGLYRPSPHVSDSWCSPYRGLLTQLLSQAFFDLENGNSELKSDLKDLYINNAM
jgi:small subunit ribosomal protein S7e